MRPAAKPAARNADLAHGSAAGRRNRRDYRLALSEFCAAVVEQGPVMIPLSCVEAIVPSRRVTDAATLAACSASPPTGAGVERESLHRLLKRHGLRSNEFKDDSSGS